jgi:hypothetical protein
MNQKIRDLILVLGFFLGNLATVYAQPPATVILPAVVVGGGGVHRIGLNLDRDSPYNNQALLQNYLQDPGFEPGTQSHLIIVGATHTAAHFTDSNNPYDPEATGFWNGVSASVRSGASAGKTFTILTYTAGGTYTCTSSCPPLAQGDLIGEEETSPSVGVVSGSNLGSGWAPQDTSWSINSSQHEAGVSSASSNVADGESHSLSFYGDSASSTVGVCSNSPSNVCQTSADCGGNTCNLWPYYPMHPISGPMMASVWALACGNSCATNSTGTPTLTLTVWRSGSSWGSQTKTFTLTNDHSWHQYSFPFTGGDESRDTSLWGYSITVSNGAAEPKAAIYVDNAFFGPTSSPARAPAWDQVAFATMQTINPGALRYMTGWGSFDALPEASYDGSDYTRGPAYTCSHTLCGDYSDWTLGALDVYQAAGALGADPWLSIPDIWSDAEVNAFATNLCSAFATYHLGHAEIEQSNEDWASSAVTAGGGNSSAYGALASRDFGLINKYMISNCPAYAGHVYFMAGGQAGNEGVETAVTAQLPKNNPQYGTEIANNVVFWDGQPAGQTMAYYAALGMENSLNEFTTGIFSDPFTDEIPDALSQVCGGMPSGCEQFFNLYENGTSNACGTPTNPATPVEAYQVSAGWVAAGFNAQNWILGFMAGSAGPNSGTLSPVPVQNTYNIAQHEYSFADNYCPTGQGLLTAIWGITLDFNRTFGPAWKTNGGHIRPIGLMEALLNQAIPQGGSYYEVTGLPSGVVCADFTAPGSLLHRLICSSNNSGAQVVSVTFPSGADLPLTARTVAYTHTMADTNEDSTAVRIEPLPGGISYTGQTATFTIPPYAGIALTE